MRFRTVLSKRDVITTLCCVVFLLANLAAIGTSGRERAKRTICLSNLRRLTLAWHNYADDNEDRIVNGAAGMNFNDDASQRRCNNCPCEEIAWAGFTYNGSVDEHIKAITGDLENNNQCGDWRLYPYVNDIKLYKCPAGYYGEYRTYSIVDSMNGWHEYRTGVDYSFVMKRRSRIKRPDKRIVFIDEGRATPDSFGVNFSTEVWLDRPPIHHYDGTIFSFADGHVEYWKWQEQRTIEIGRMGGYNIPAPDSIDLQRVQLAVWGELGYMQ